MISAARAGAGFWERGASIGVESGGQLDVRKHVAPEGVASASPLSPCGFEQLVLRDHFVDEAELQSFLRG